MLTAIRQVDRTKVIALLEEKTGLVYLCPFCDQPVILKKGEIKIHHFAHAVNANCPFKKESAERAALKYDIFSYLQQQYASALTTLELETFVEKGVRADIFLETKKRTRIAIEIYADDITQDELLEKTKMYYQKRVHVLWVAPFDAKRYIKDHWNSNNLEGQFKIRLKAGEVVLSRLYHNSLTLWDLSHEHSRSFIQMEVGASYKPEIVVMTNGKEVDSYQPKHKLLRTVQRMTRNVDFKDYQPEFRNMYVHPKWEEFSVPARAILVYSPQKPK